MKGITKKLDKARVERIIKAALKEDIGRGDITTKSVIPSFESVKGEITTKEECVVCGLEIAEWIVNTVDSSVRFKPQVNEGQRAFEDKVILFLEGQAKSILACERTILNFLSFLSAIATKTNTFVEKVKPYGTKIYDTRKTFPLLRYLEKYAVRIGGGFNHRIGLWDQVLVKENHLKVIKEKKKNLVPQIKKKITKNVLIEIEVETLEEMKTVIEQKPNIILLDNMSPEDVEKAVKMRDKKENKKISLEVSGGITFENVEAYAKTGVDRISIGSLTHSVKSVDMNLEIL